MKLENMTAPQRQAVETDHPNVFVVAGPGSGKTTVLAERIARLITSGVPSARIVAITYTNAAARNIEQRVNDATPLTAGEDGHREIIGTTAFGFAGTLHGFCLRMLREYGEPAGYGLKTAVLDEDSANELLAAKIETVGCKDPIKKVIALKRFGRPIRVAGSVFDKAQLAILSYMDELKESSLLDFDLILTEFARVLKASPAIQAAIHSRFEHLLDDEVQDHAATDWEIISALPIANKFLVGDPDQAIFGFRGGRVGYAVRHSYRPDVQVILLGANFRCSEETCTVANRLIAHNKGRILKATFPGGVAPRGQVDVFFSPAANEAAEVDQVVDSIMQYYTENDGTVAVLARTNAIADKFREALQAEDLQLEEAPRSEMPADWPRARSLIEVLAQPNNDTLAFFYMVARATDGGASALAARNTAAKVKRDAQARGQTVNDFWFHFPREIQDVPQVAGHFADKEGLCRESVMLIAEMANKLPPGSTMLDLALEVASRDRPPAPKPSEGVTVTTIHDAKGREWDQVYLVGMEDEVIPGHRKTATDDDIEEERRLFFVALTRSRGDVWITHSANRRANWGQKPLQPHTPSRFIEEALT